MQMAEVRGGVPRVGEEGMGALQYFPWPLLWVLTKGRQIHSQAQLTCK